MAQDRIIKPRCYVSGKISGLPKQAYMERFARAEARLRECGFDVCNPTTSWVVKILSRISYRLTMWYDLHLLRHCDCIYMMYGWESSNGANMEHQCALRCYKPVLYSNYTDKGLRHIADKMTETINHCRQS
mgnify:CR=1 FL=1